MAKILSLQFWKVLTDVARVSVIVSILLVSFTWITSRVVAGNDREPSEFVAATVAPSKPAAESRGASDAAGAKTTKTKSATARIEDASGKGIAGAKVYARSGNVNFTSGATDSFGTVKFTYAESAKIEISAEASDRVSDVLTFRREVPENIKIVCKGAGSIGGMVVFRGAPAAGVRVVAIPEGQSFTEEDARSITLNQSLLKSAVSESSGMFQIERLTADSKYTIFAGGGGFIASPVRGVQPSFNAIQVKASWLAAAKLTIITPPKKDNHNSDNHTVSIFGVPESTIQPSHDGTPFTVIGLGNPSLVLAGLDIADLKPLGPLQYMFAAAVDEPFDDESKAPKIQLSLRIPRERAQGVIVALKHYLGGSPAALNFAIEPMKPRTARLTINIKGISKFEADESLVSLQPNAACLVDLTPNDSDGSIGYRIHVPKNAARVDLEDVVPGNYHAQLKLTGSSALSSSKEATIKPGDNTLELDAAATGAIKLQLTQGPVSALQRVSLRIRLQRTKKSQLSFATGECFLREIPCVIPNIPEGEYELEIYNSVPVVKLKSTVSAGKNEIESVEYKARRVSPSKFTVKSGETTLLTLES